MYKKSWNPLVDPKIARVHGCSWPPWLRQSWVKWPIPNTVDSVETSVSTEPQARSQAAALQFAAKRQSWWSCESGRDGIIQNEADLGSSYTTHAHGEKIPMLTTEKPRFSQVNPHTSSTRIQTSQQNKFNPYFNMSNPILTSSPVIPSCNFTSYTLILSNQNPTQQTNVNLRWRQLYHHAKKNIES